MYITKQNKYESIEKFFKNYENLDKKPFRLMLINLLIFFSDTFLSFSDSCLLQKPDPEEQT